MAKKAVFIAATGQHVGKTTVCLGLLAALKKRFCSVGFIKPVGQQHSKVEGGVNVDKDVYLFKHHYSLPGRWSDMSPVIIPSGMTRDYLDGKFCERDLLSKIQHSFQIISSENDFVVVEGTGHVGVGSIVNLNNASVASYLGLEIILIASGGLGSSYDELELNIAMCEKNNVKVKGVILNKVLEDKRQMVLEYFPKSLKRWQIPLIGAIPYSEFLSQPTVCDFANLFHTDLLSGKEHSYRHFCHIRLVAESLEVYENEMIANELVITPACREDIVVANINKHLEMAKLHTTDFSGGLILTGFYPPSEKLLQKIQQAKLPILYVPLCSYEVMKRINTFTSKIRKKDSLKIDKAVSLFEKHIDFDLLLS